MKKIFLLLTITFLFLTMCSNKEVQAIKKGGKQTFNSKIYVLNTKKLYSYIKDLNIKFPKIVTAQALIESGNFQSKIFKENKNIFGMKKAGSRPSTNISNSKSYAKYNSWKESVIDYALFQASFARNIKTEEEYFKFLENYASSPDYKNHILKTMKHVNYQ